MSGPNYRALTPPSEKERTEYTWAERRAELYDAIERNGHYRNLECSQRQIAEWYGVSQPQIKKDLDAVNEWMVEHFGDDAEAELITLKTKAVQELLDREEFADAYRLMADHYKILLDAGAAEQEKSADKHEHAGDGGAALDVVINRERYEPDDEDE